MQNRNLKARLRNIRTGIACAKWLPQAVVLLAFVGLFVLLNLQLQRAMSQTIAYAGDSFTLQIEHADADISRQIEASAVQWFNTSSIRHLRTMDAYNTHQSAVGQMDLENFVSTGNIIDNVVVFNGNLGMFFTSNGRFSHSFDGRYGFHDRDAVQMLSNPEQYALLSPIVRIVDGELYYSFLFFNRADIQAGALLLNVSARQHAAVLLESVSTASGVILDDQGQSLAYYDARLALQIRSSWPQFAPTSQASSPVLPGDNRMWFHHHLEELGAHFIYAPRLDDTAPGIVYMRAVFRICIAAFGILFLLTLINLPIRGRSLYRRFVGKFYPEDVVLGDSSLLLSSDNRDSKFVNKIKSLRNGSSQAGTGFPVLLIQSDYSLGPLCKEVAAYYPDMAMVDDVFGTVALIEHCNEYTIDEMHRYFSEKTAAPLYFSDLCHDMKQLQSSFTALEELRRLRFLYQDKQVMHEKLLRECSEVSTLSTKSVSAMIGFLRNGDLEQAVAEWCHIFESIRTDSYAGVCYAIQYIEKQLNTLVPELIPEAPALSDNILGKLRDIELIHRYIEELFETITKSVSCKKHEQIKLLAHRVDEYIRESYADDELSAQQIADSFGINQVHLSRQFREMTGVSINDAIHQVRIEKAQQMLKDSDESVELIAKHSGYPNTKYFFVVFKKITGVTPSQFRKVGAKNTI